MYMLTTYWRLLTKMASLARDMGQYTNNSKVQQNLLKKACALGVSCKTNVEFETTRVCQ